MKKVKSLPTKLNHYRCAALSSMSCHDFEALILKGQQTYLSYGEYCQKPDNSKTNRRKIIAYAYKQLRLNSKL